MDWSNLQERDAFLTRFLGLCELFNVAADEFKTELYFRALQRFDTQDVVRGIDKAVTRCRFFPKPVELIELIEGNADDIAEVEAVKVIEAVKRVGSWRSVAFDNPVTAAVVQQGFGGWVKLCSEMNAKEEKWFRKDFCRLYVSFTRQNIQHTGILAGQSAVSNSAHCKEHYEATAFVGNADKARAALNATRQQAVPITMQLVESLAMRMDVKA